MHLLVGVIPPVKEAQVQTGLGRALPYSGTASSVFTLVVITFSFEKGEA
nr:hypothetical protein [uncultured Rhodoferax sp.]